MILADTSVWVAHFRESVPLLQEFLIDNRVLMHPWVIGELACGTLPRRPQVLRWLGRIPAAEVARDGEVLTLIEDKHLWGKGIGWVDAQLLASALITECELWTRDERLHGEAKRLGLAFPERKLIQ
jgi:predicted nucleic acid-binding protein